jgi:hypothetical protein
MRALTKWLSDKVTMKRIETDPNIHHVSPLSEYAESAGLFDAQLKLHHLKHKGKKGRPLSKLSKFVPFENIYDPETWRKNLRAPIPVGGEDWCTTLARRIRNYGESHRDERERHLSGWCQEIANGLDAGDVLATADAALRALEELERLHDQYVMPYAQMARESRRSNAKGGKKTQQKR